MKAISRIPRLVWFLSFFLWELAVANFDVARIVLSRRLDLSPGIVRVPIRSESDFEVTMLANLISLTPGTITIEVERDHAALFVHGLHIDSPETFRSSINRLEDKLLKALR